MWGIPREMVWVPGPGEWYTMAYVGLVPYYLCRTTPYFIFPITNTTGSSISRGYWVKLHSTHVLPAILLRMINGAFHGQNQPP